MIGTVRIIRVTYLEDDVFEGSIPPEAYENAWTDVYEVDDVAEAVDVIQRHGLTFAATGNDWAANPDGSYVSNYATVERVEESAHLDGFTDEQVAEIMDRVG